MSTVIWVSGASSGIGAAFVDARPDAAARVIGIARRPHPGAEHLRADLADPASWPLVTEHFADVLAGREHDEALFFHCAGTLVADGPLLETDAADYTAAVLLNAASGQVLGRAFLVAAARAGCMATLVMCSSPAARDALPGLSHYCAGKAALEHWARAVGTELGDAARVLSIVPHAVDTPMVRGLMAEPPDGMPIGELFRQAAAADALASPEQVAREIWAGLERQLPPGAALDVGATGFADGRGTDGAP